MVDEARAAGAEILAGGARPGASHLGAGAYYLPTVIAGIANSARIAQEEIFGPVLCVLPFDDEDDLLAQANDSAFGLGASLWSNDLARVQSLIPRIAAGTIWVNTHNMLDPNMPFGGFKQSGIGREHGRAVLDLYLEKKSVCIAY
jgi:phenylacetaldehyde dehydrogenase